MNLSISPFFSTSFTLRILSLCLVYTCLGSLRLPGRLVLYHSVKSLCVLSNFLCSKVNLFDINIATSLF